MEYRRLGSAGVKVSILGLGCNPFGTWLDEETATRLVHYAIDQGINFFDTSDTYSDGLSEEFLGKALKGKRSNVLIATKVGMIPWSKRHWTVGHGDIESATESFEQNPNYGTSRYHIMRAVDESLRRLQTDHIDLYQIHVPDPTTPIDETLRTLDNLVRMGKVRYIGCSNFKSHQLCQAMETSKRLNLEAFVTAQECYNLIDRDIEHELVPYYQVYGLGFIPYRPLRSGFLTGKYQRGKEIPPGSRYDVRPDLMKGDFLADRNFDILDKLEKFAMELNHGVGQLAIAWLASHSWISSIIAGATKTEQIAANLKGSQWKLSPHEIAQVEAIIDEVTEKNKG